METDRLRRLLNRTNELEALQSTVLSQMSDGVTLHGADGAVSAQRTHDHATVRYVVTP